MQKYFCGAYMVAQFLIRHHFFKERHHFDPVTFVLQLVLYGIASNISEHLNSIVNCWTSWHFGVFLWSPFFELSICHSDIVDDILDVSDGLFLDQKLQLGGMKCDPELTFKLRPSHGLMESDDSSAGALKKSRLLLSNNRWLKESGDRVSSGSADDEAGNSSTSIVIPETPPIVASLRTKRRKGTPRRAPLWTPFIRRQKAKKRKKDKKIIYTMWKRSYIIEVIYEEKS